MRIVKKAYLITTLFLLLIRNGYTEVIYYFGGSLSSNWGTLVAGTLFHGSFSYEHPQAPNSFPFGSGAFYTFNNFSVTIGAENPNLHGNGAITVWNYNQSYPNDSLKIEQSGNSFLGGQEVTSVAIWLNDTSGLWLSSPSLPAAFSLSDFTPFLNSTGTGFYINGTFGSELTYLVPEPSALSLLAVGLGGLAMIRRRRS